MKKRLLIIVLALIFIVIGRNVLAAQAKPQPVILSVQGVDSYMPIADYVILSLSQIEFKSVLMAEDLSGVANPSQLVIYDSKNQIVRRDNLEFSNQGGRLIAEADIIMRDQNNKQLASGEYAVRVLGFLNQADRTAKRRSYASEPVRLIYRYPIVNVDIDAPKISNTGGYNSLPACVVRVRARQKMTAFKFPDSFTSFALVPVGNIGSLRSGQDYKMSDLGSQMGYYDIDLSKQPQGSLVSWSVKGYYKIDGKANGGVAQSKAAVWKIFGTDKNTTNLFCGRANNQYWLNRPQFSDLCANGSGTITSGPGGEKFFWRAGDEAWRWYCDDVCVNQNSARVMCASLVPELTLSKKETANKSFDLRVDSNFDLDLIVSSVQLWKVPLGGSYRSLGAKKLGTFNERLSANAKQLRNVSTDTFKIDLGYEIVAIALAKNIANDFGAIIGVISNSTEESPSLINGVCGSAHNQSFTQMPTTGFCSAGSLSLITGDGPWEWTCFGKNGGSDAHCKANKEVIVKVDGVCGEPNKKLLTEKPQTGLCASGMASAVAGEGPWSWTCSGSNGGVTVNCEAYKSNLKINGQCGLANGQTVAVKPTDNLCSNWTLPPVYGEGPWYWFCPGFLGGTSDSCMANKIPESKIDGVCGPAHNQSFTTIPTSGLCDVGTASVVSGNGPWSWFCIGKNGGVNASCQAQKTNIETLSPVTLTAVNGTEANASIPGTKVRLLVDSQTEYNHIYIRNDQDKILIHRVPGSMNYVGGATFGRPWLFEWSVFGLDAGNYVIRAVAAKSLTGEIIQSDPITITITKTILPPSENEKNPSKYLSKQAFIINDLDWQKVLSLVPATVWTQSDGSVVRYPLLVYKNESGKIDIDSTIRFIQQYQPEKVTLVSQDTEERNRLASYISAGAPLGGGMAIDKINAINADDYLNFWQKYSTVVRSDGKYETSLHAATYASLINAPLIIKGTINDKAANLDGRKIICVGDVDGRCDEKYTIDSLATRYAVLVKELTGQTMNKIVFTNAKDLYYSLKKDKGLKTERSGDTVYNLYGKHSLMAPYLAAAKQELLLTAYENIGNTNDANDPYYYTTNLKQSNPGSNCEDITNKFNCAYEQNRIKEMVQRLNWSFDQLYDPNINGLGIGGNRKIYKGFLTILADPQSIPFRSFDMKTNDQTGAVWLFDSADKTIFANIDSKYGPSLAYGRIAGLTISDASAYINRAVFYDKIPATKNFGMFATKANGIDTGINFMTKACSVLKANGYSQNACILRPDLDQYSDIYNINNFKQTLNDQIATWKNTDLMHYWDHGSSDFSGIWTPDIPDLSNTVIISMSCSTAEASRNINLNTNSNFALEAIRKGAIAYIGAVGIAYEFNSDRLFINDTYYNKTTPIGIAFRNNTGHLLDYDTLLGDPTIVLSSQPGFVGVNSNLLQ